MARITVQDCLEHTDNRFDLVLLATRRARQLANGVDSHREKKATPVPGDEPRNISAETKNLGLYRQVFSLFR